MRRYLPTAALVAGIIVTWHLLVAWTGVQPWLLPSPLDVLQALADPKWQWLEQARSTSIVVLGGFALAGVIGVLLGVLISWSDAWRKAVLPLLVFLNSLPKIAMAPLFVIWLGYGIIPNMWIAFLVAFFPVALNTAAGLGEIEEDMLDLARSLQTPKWKTFLFIRIPNALPFIFSGLKIASTQAVIGAIVAEFIAATSGLAALIMTAQASLATPAILGGLVWIAGIGLALYGLVSLAQVKLMPWSQGKSS